MEFRHFQTYRLPRGRRNEPPFIQSAPAAAIARPELRGVRSRRGRFLVVATDAAPFVQSIERKPRRLPARRQIRLSATPWPQAQAPVAPPWPPVLVVRRGRVAFARRGIITEPPWPQAAPPPTQWPPAMLSRRVRFGGTGRRSRLTVPVFVQDVPVVAPRRRPLLALRRQARPSVLVYADASVPQSPSRRRWPIAFRRRGALMTFQLGNAAAAPVASPPVTIRTRATGGSGLTLAGPASGRTRATTSGSRTRSELED